MRWNMSEAKNRKCDWREHFEVVALTYELFQMSSAANIFIDRLAQRANPDRFEQHPDFQCPEPPGKLGTVIPECESLVCFLSNHAGVLSIKGKRSPGCVGLTV